MVAPDVLIPVAERSGLIGALTSAVLRQSVTACASWREAGHEIGVAVNLSASSLDPELADQVADLLKDHQLPAHLLTLEITEGSVMKDLPRALELLGRLREMGVRLSIDDFRTGYSSLSYLTRLPVHEVKIDRSFVTHMAVDPDDAMIVQSIIDLGRNLSLSVVAEGVENAATWARLGEMGCAYGQGHHLSEALPIGTFLPWLRQRSDPEGSDAEGSGTWGGPAASAALR